MRAMPSLGGRFKKEMVVDGQSHLLLIRDEGGPPEAQVSTENIVHDPIDDMTISRWGLFV